MRKSAPAIFLVSLITACGGGSDSGESQSEYGSVRINGAPFDKDKLDACKAYLNESNGSYVGEELQTYITLDGCTDDPFQTIKFYQVTYTDAKKTPYTSVTYTIAKYASAGDYQATYDATWKDGSSAPVQIDRSARRITFSNLPLPLNDWGGSKPRPVGTISVDGQLNY